MKKNILTFLVFLIVVFSAFGQTTYTTTTQIRLFPVTKASDTTASTANDGRIWYDFTSDKIRAIVGGVAVTLGTGSGGGGAASWGSITGTLSSQVDLQAALDAKANEILAANVQTSNYVLALTDADSKVVVMDVGSANTVTVPPNGTIAFPVGTVITINQQGSGLTTITPGVGVTVNPSAGTGVYDSPGQNTVMVLYKTATNTWQLWNGTGSAVSSIATNSPITGGPITSSGTIGIDNAAADGSTKGAASFTANDFDATTGNVSIDYTNGQASSGSTKGFLTSADWTTFNNKQATGLSWLLTGSSTLSTPILTGFPTFRMDNIVTTPTDGMMLENSTAATVGVPVQYSPALHFKSNAWKTGVANSQPVDFRIFSLPSSSASVAGSLTIATQVESGGYNNHYFFHSGGTFTVGATTGTINVSGAGGTLSSQNYIAPSNSTSVGFRLSGGAVSPGLDITTNGTTISSAATTYTGIRYTSAIGYTAGTGTVRGFANDLTMNTGATWVGTYIGYDYNPTLTSTTGTTNIAYRATSGSVLFGGSTLTAGGSVLMDLQSTTQALLLPRVTNIASVATPVNGMIAYDAATNLFNFRQNSAWVNLGGITNTAAANELSKSNGTNLVPSGLFTLSASTLTPTVGNNLTIRGFAPASGNGGNVELAATNAFIGGGGNGGSLSLASGIGDGAGVGAAIYINPGNDVIFLGTQGETGTGSIAIQVPPGGASGNDGSSISFTAADAYSVSGNGNGGDITLTSGARRAAGSGVDGDITIETLNGNGTLKLNDGANEQMGLSTLVGGTVVVNNTKVTANSRIFLTHRTTGGTIGILTYTIVAGTSFTITSSSGTDTSTVNWLIIEPN
jgi:hypothetical protein